MKRIEKIKRANTDDIIEELFNDEINRGGIPREAEKTRNRIIAELQRRVKSGETGFLKEGRIQNLANEILDRVLNFVLDHSRDIGASKK